MESVGCLELVSAADEKGQHGVPNGHCNNKLEPNCIWYHGVKCLASTQGGTLEQT